MSVKELQEIISPNFNEEVVKKIVEKTSSLTDVIIQEIQIRQASTLQGDCYLSNICRFTIKANGINHGGQEESTSIPVIVKYFLKNLARRKTFRSFQFFENEIIFYEKYWEPIKRFQNEVPLKQKFNKIPLVLATHLEENDGYIAMYDLSLEGLKSVERGDGLDLTHTNAILQLLAQFHAMSLSFKQHRPEEFEEAATKLKETYFSEETRPWYSNFQKNCFKVVEDAIRKELPVEYYEKFHKLIKLDFFGMIIRACTVRGPLSVVTHGDVWPPNFMISYNENTEIEKLCIIDFQLARYTTLATDLVLFLFNCVKPELISTKWDEFVEYYHKNLTESLDNYNCKQIITLDQLVEEMKEYSALGVGMSMEALIIGQLDVDEVSDLDGIQGDEAVPLESVWIVNPFQDQIKRKRIAAMIKLAADKNFI